MTSVEALEHSLQIIGNREPQIGAWAFLDRSIARAEAVRLDRSTVGPLSGLTAGVKDVYDTSTMPTSYGSPIWSGHRPERDAVLVGKLRAAGALCIGKTVTSEFACSHPGMTRNPWNSHHTPGGSSMGSAAAVAAGMVDLALGTQTLGSVVRPASFCGVWGFKPTWGAVSFEGVKVVAPTLDTVGWFARSSALIEDVWWAVLGRTSPIDSDRLPSFALLHSDTLRSCERESREALFSFAHEVKALGAEVVETTLGESFEHLSVDVPTLMAVEAATSLAWEVGHASTLLSPAIGALVQMGRSVDPEEVVGMMRRRRRAQADHDAPFGGADVVITPSALGEAPRGLDSTGDPSPARLWTALGLPVLSIPYAVGPNGLPVGVQMVGRPNAEGVLLATARLLERFLPLQSPKVSGPRLT